MPKIFSTCRCTAGVRVWPPTRITLSISAGVSLASVRAFSQKSGGPLDQVLAPALRSGSRVRILSKCFGPLPSAAINGRLMCDLRRQRKARIWPFPPFPSGAGAQEYRSPRLIPVSALNSAIIQSMMQLVEILAAQEAVSAGGERLQRRRCSVRESKYRRSRRPDRRSQPAPVPSYPSP